MTKMTVATKKARPNTLPSGNFVVDIRKETEEGTLRWRLSTRTKSSREHEKRAALLRDLAQSSEGRAILDRLKARSLSIEEVVGALSAGGKGMSALRSVSRAVTLSEAIDSARSVLKGKGSRAKTLIVFRGVERSLVARFGARTEIAKLDESALRAWLWESGWSGKTQRKKRAYAAQIWEEALRLDRERSLAAHRRPTLHSNPWSGVKAAKIVKPERRFMSKEEIAKMLDTLESIDLEGALFLACGFLGGMRIGEARTLAWEDVDFDEGTIRLREKRGWAPKTGARTLHAPSRLLRMLQSASERASSAPFIFGGKAPWGDMKATREAKRALLKAEVGEVGRGKGWTFHHGRHSAISNALRAGVPPIKVSKQMGVGVATLLREYAHVFDEDTREVARALD